MEQVTVSVHSGICGFECQVEVRCRDKQLVVVEITGSECRMVNDLNEKLPDIGLNDLFVSRSENAVFRCAEEAHCHLGCPVPVAVIKASEVAMGLALKKDVSIRFT